MKIDHRNVNNNNDVSNSNNNNNNDNVNKFVYSIKTKMIFSVISSSQKPL